MAKILHWQCSSPMSVVAMAAVHDCGFQLVDHPPYSPDYFLFLNMKKTTSLSWWKQDSLRQFSIHSQNISSTTFQSPELRIQCWFIWKETTQLVSGKVEFNACQVSLLWHNSFLVSLWSFQPTLLKNKKSFVFLILGFRSYYYFF